jgi:hypothetical protein
VSARDSSSASKARLPLEGEGHHGAGLDVDVEHRSGAAIDHTVLHARAGERLLLQQVGELAIGLGEHRLVGARARGHLVASLEVADVAVLFGLDDEDALAHVPRRPGRDAELDHHTQRIVGVGGVELHRGAREASFVVERGELGPRLVEHRGRELGAVAQAGHVERLAAIEHAAHHVDLGDEATGHEAHHELDPVALGLCAHARRRDPPRGDQLAQELSAERLGQGRADARAQRRRRLPARPLGHELDLAHHAAHEPLRQTAAWPDVG